MATKKTDPEEKAYAQLVVKAINDGGAEVRLADEKGNMRFVGRNKAGNKEFEVGQTVEMILRVVSEPPPPDKVVAEIRTEDLPEGARVIEG